MCRGEILLVARVKESWEIGRADQSTTPGGFYDTTGREFLICASASLLRAMRVWVIRLCCGHR